MGEGRGVYRVLVGKPEEKRPLGRPRRILEDNIKMDLQELGCAGIEWTELAQDRERWRVLANAIMNLWVPQNAGNFLTSCKPVSFTRMNLLHGVGNYEKYNNTVDPSLTNSIRSRGLVVTQVGRTSRPFYP
jgi:hypothetical protein